MVSTSSVSSIYSSRDELTHRRVQFRQTKTRYLVVLLACLVIFGCQYCFDTPGALQTDIESNQKQEGKKLSETSFNLLYSIYSIPNIFVALLGGMLIDAKGPGLVMIITSSLCAFGQGIVSVGGMNNWFVCMLIGRGVFGLGGEILHNSKNTLISKWFHTSQLSMILGISISLPKLGSALNAIVSPTIAGRYSSKHFENVGIPLLIGLGVMLISTLFALLLAYIDKSTIEKEKILQDIQHVSQTSKKISSDNTSSSKDSSEHFSCSTVKDLPAIFWVLLLVSVLTESLFIPFLDNGNKYFQIVFKSVTNAQQAGVLMIFPYCIAAICVPPLGYFVDKVQNRGKVLIISNLFILGTYTYMMILETYPRLRQGVICQLIPPVLLGICVAISCSVVIPTVPMIIPHKLFGTGFGMIDVAQNFGLAAFPLITAVIRETSSTLTEFGLLNGFHRQTLFYFIISCLCFSFSVILYGVDYISERKLQGKRKY